MPPKLTLPKANRPVPSPAQRGPDGEAARARPQVEGDTHEADRAFHAMLARMTGGISPAALLLAIPIGFCIWRRRHSGEWRFRRRPYWAANRFLEAALHYFSPDQGPWSLIKPQAQDRRFSGTEWESPPFNLLAQAFLLGQQWWHDASTGVRGVAKPNEAVVEFSMSSRSGR